MKVSHSKLKGCVIIEPSVFGDERGFFLETFQAVRYQQEAGIDLPFVQDNHSRSARGVLRGLHFQKTKPQGKLVRVVGGEVFDVVVDIRRGSKTFGWWESVVLSEENKKQFWVPPRFVHGFVVLSEIADFDYKCTDYYAPETEGAVLWNSCGIEWPLSVDPILSGKDQEAPPLADFASPFVYGQNS